MKQTIRDASRIMTVMMGLSGLILCMACSSSGEEVVIAPDGSKLVKAQFNFSLPIRRTQAATRMTDDVVQSSGTDDQFRGMDDVRLLCFDDVPTASSTKLGNMIEMKTSGSEVATDVTTDDYSLCQEIAIPVGTSHFGFYAQASQDNSGLTVHEACMKYGIIETVGLDKDTYQDNSTIRFKPVQLCTSTALLGGSTVGHQLLNLLNELMSISTTAAAAPNDRWETVENMYLNEAYARMTQLSALSTYNVQTMLAAVNRIVNLEGPDDQGQELAAAITAKIAACCTTAPTATSETITLKDEYQGFPADLHLPDGAVRIVWNDDAKRFVVAENQDYGNGLTVPSITNYVYPMNLQYQVFSDILASERMVLQLDGNTTGSEYENWDELIENGYAGATNTVQQTTQSVAMVKQVEYAVGRLSLEAKLATPLLPDADGKSIDVAGGFTLKGYIVGGQREVDYSFTPVAGSPRYAIYDTDLNGGEQKVRCGSVWTVPDYILGLGTDPDESIKVALELVNDGENFQGADGTIAHGATFYLVASLKPSEGTNYNERRNQIFNRDQATHVRMNITSLANATNGLPDLDSPVPTVGISVNMHWGEGLWYEQEL